MQEPVFLTGRPQEFADNSIHAVQTQNYGVDFLRETGKTVLLWDCARGGSDAAYKRDKFVVIDNKVVLARHPNSTRCDDIGDIRQIVKDEYIIELKRPGSYLKGSDVLGTINSVTPISWGAGTTMDAVEEMQEHFPERVFLPLEQTGLQSNSAAYFLPKNDLIIHPDACTKEAVKDARNLAESAGGAVYSMTDAEAKTYGSGILPLCDTHLLTVGLGGSQSCTDSLRHWLFARNYKAHEIDCKPFMLEGGDWRRLFNSVNQDMLTPEA
ncbi:MAG TPA: hypothetical protein VFR09_08170, partial [Alphaproteobacteria bacterium]|nr:hypothetical protein [Alphaproteobacteria bacterium]